jgi:hypothetical protein
MYIKANIYKYKGAHMNILNADYFTLSRKYKNAIAEQKVTLAFVSLEINQYQYVKE